MIKGQYAILIADKSNNTYVIHCKKHLAEQVLKEITTTETYTKEKEREANEILDEHEKWMLEEKLVMPEEKNGEGVIITPEHLLFNRKLPHLGTVKVD